MICSIKTINLFSSWLLKFFFEFVLSLYQVCLYMYMYTYVQKQYFVINIIWGNVFHLILEFPGYCLLSPSLLHPTLRWYCVHRLFSFFNLFILTLNQRYSSMFLNIFQHNFYSMFYFTEKLEIAKDVNWQVSTFWLNITSPPNA